MKASPTLCFLLAGMLLLQQPVAALNWQGTGNLHNDNLTVIWDYIDGQLQLYESTQTYNLFITALSDQLNSKWDPAWNVLMVMNINIGTRYNDAILYGYAFRNHWMWFNGYQHARISSIIFSFVIWKDYNCRAFKTVGNNAALEDSISGFSPAQKDFVKTLLDGATAAQVLTDPWTMAKGLVDAVEGSSLFVVANNHAFSVVLNQAAYDQIYTYARLCMVDNMFFYSIKDYKNFLAQENNKQYGSIILFQTR